MSDDLHRKSHVPSAVLAVVGGFVLYVLSIGPAYAFLEPDFPNIGSIYFADHEWASKFYFPVIFMAMELDLIVPLCKYMIWCWMVIH